MSYIKTNWTDGENKYDIKTQTDTIISNDVKLVYKGVSGTAVSSTNMNKLEDGVYQVYNNLQRKLRMGGLI